MIEEAATVIAVEGEWAQVSAMRQAACGQCGAQGACGTAMIARLFPGHDSVLRVHNPIGARVGERVALGLATGVMLRLTALAYLMPAAALILGAVLGERLGGPHAGPASILGALSGLGLAFWLLGIYSLRLARQPAHQPVILRRLDDA
ncbi:SoxR reducing system RseC family protein [Caldichromatium japonicum]|uniref:SoxR reducing system RseC family protein n=1 Tax=Caldichromatium japonicum TaxID=2699430 RepID=A0A6G7VB26_9GAMM|nr:SoxR reducing system RseC family protein [Caldichromatium japonicum]QIK37110.1 SoxR reducing system RseC family protein [Caldichromatium japonicum]